MGVLELAKVLYLGQWNTPGGATPDVWDIKIIIVLVIFAENNKTYTVHNRIMILNEKHACTKCTIVL